MTLKRMISKKVSVCVICEGSEEYDYLSRLRALNIWSETYKVDLVDAQGNGNLPARYQDKYQNDMYDLVLVFCDTDKKPYEQYNEIKGKIDRFHGIEGISNRLVIFGNPCTMQIIIEHFAEVLLPSPAKKRNAPLIETFTGISDYRARQEQRAALMNLINRDNFSVMLERVSRLSSNDAEKNSSNFDILMRNLSDADTKWIEEINEIM
jgi:hypothetical protein